MLIPVRKLASTFPSLILLAFLFYLTYKFAVKQEETIQVGKTLKVRSSQEDDDLVDKIDWHDWKRIGEEKSRTGPGEQGKKVDPKSVEKSGKNAYESNGFNAFVSDVISVHRSIPDIRHPGCKTQKYRKELPMASIIIPYHNEHWSTLLRTFHSVLDRSPPSLLKEIILIDDASSKAHCKEPVDKYVKENGLSDKIKVFHMKERGGLILARSTGAKMATGEVLIFLDSHTEANINWLPPLLEPISENYRTAVCPFIDVIDNNNFEYRAQDQGARGAFDWELFYKRLPLLLEDLKNPTRPFKSPVMAGGLFAISSKFFWELGGYDEGLQIWGGEQYELSFKIWQCGGQMFDAPCSRVGHIYRLFAPFSSGGKGDYLAKNYKRVAVVWMDEYAEYIYRRQPRYRNINPGDVSKQLELRKKLQCKPFKWFIENVAFDLVKKYPPIEPPDFGNGTISSFADPSLCVDSLYKPVNSKLELRRCGQGDEQDFVLAWQKDIRLMQRPSYCWDVTEPGKAPIVLYMCHTQGGNQLWKYVKDRKWLMHGGISRCLDYDPETQALFVSSCDIKSKTQKWVIKNLNEERLETWDSE